MSIEPFFVFLLSFFPFFISPNLRLTMALRMDRNLPETCAASCFGHFVTQFQNLNHGVTIPYNQAVATGLHQAFPDMQTIAWCPRIGFAWTPNTDFTKPGSTVIRGRFGVFPDLYPGFLADRLIVSSPTSPT